MTSIKLVHAQPASWEGAGVGAPVYGHDAPLYATVVQKLWATSDPADVIKRELALLLLEDPDLRLRMGHAEQLLRLRLVHRLAHVPAVADARLVPLALADAASSRYFVLQPGGVVRLAAPQLLLLLGATPSDSDPATTISSGSPVGSAGSDVTAASADGYVQLCVTGTAVSNAAAGWRQDADGAAAAAAAAAGMVSVPPASGEDSQTAAAQAAIFARLASQMVSVAGGRVLGPGNPGNAAVASMHTPCKPPLDPAAGVATPTTARAQPPQASPGSAPLPSYLFDFEAAGSPSSGRASVSPGFAAVTPSSVTPTRLHAAFGGGGGSGSANSYASDPVIADYLPAAERLQSGVRLTPGGAPSQPSSGGGLWAVGNSGGDAFSALGTSPSVHSLLASSPNAALSAGSAPHPAMALGLLLQHDAVAAAAGGSKRSSMGSGASAASTFGASLGPPPDAWRDAASLWPGDATRTSSGAEAALAGSNAAAEAAAPPSQSPATGAAAAAAAAGSGSGGGSVLAKGAVPDEVASLWGGGGGGGGGQQWGSPEYSRRRKVPSLYGGTSWQQPGVSPLRAPGAAAAAAADDEDDQQPPQHLLTSSEWLLTSPPPPPSRLRPDAAASGAAGSPSPVVSAATTQAAAAAGGGGSSSGSRKGAADAKATPSPAGPAATTTAFARSPGSYATVAAAASSTKAAANRGGRPTAAAAADGGAADSGSSAQHLGAAAASTPRSMASVVAAPPAASHHAGAAPGGGGGGLNGYAAVAARQPSTPPVASAANSTGSRSKDGQPTPSSAGSPSPYAASATPASSSAPSTAASAASAAPGPKTMASALAAAAASPVVTPGGGMRSGGSAARAGSAPSSAKQGKSGGSVKSGGGSGGSGQPLGKLSSRLREEVLLVVSAVSGLCVDDFDEGVVHQLCSKRSEDEAAAAVRSIREHDLTNIQHVAAFLNHLFRHYHTSAAGGGEGGGGGGGSASASVRAASMPVSSKAMLQKLPLRVYRRLEEIVSSTGCIELKHFDAGVVKVMSQLAELSVADVLEELDLLAGSDLSGIDHISAYLNKRYNNRLWTRRKAAQ